MASSKQYEDKGYVISEFIMSGTNEGEFIWITPTNKVIEITGINSDKIIDGKIVEHSGDWRQQTGECVTLLVRATK